MQENLLTDIIGYLAYLFFVYYFYVSCCCIWYVLEFLKRDPLDTMSLPDELMYRLTFGLIK